MKLFIASTVADLSDYRERARCVIENVGHSAELVEKFATEQPLGIVGLLKSILRICHGCVLIVGLRRGSGPMDAIDEQAGPSFTMIEFFEAVEAKVPLLVYFVEAEFDRNHPDREWMTTFRDEVAARFSPKRIRSVDEFESSLRKDIPEWERLASTIDPVQRVRRPIVGEQMEQIFGVAIAPLMGAWIKSFSDGRPKSQRTVSQLQGYPRDTSQPAFKQADSLNSAGWICHEQTKYSEAIDYYDRAIRLCPKFPLVWHNKGLAHFRLGQARLSETSCFEAIRLAPGFVKPWLQMGILYWEHYHDIETAKRWVNRALMVDPVYPDARFYSEQILSVVEMLNL